jgi:hypothetical protein
VELDHVVIAVPDLEAAAAEFEARYGLVSVEGGRHPGWGTANRIVPLGDSYLELIAVVDADEASLTNVGSWVAQAATRGSGPLGWVVRTNRLDEIAGRLGLEAHAGSRHRPDGTEARWRTVGLDEAAAEPFLPFFIEWAEGTTLPGHAQTAAGAIASLALSGDPERLATWLGDHSLPVTMEPGPPGVRKVVLEAVGGRSIEIGD